MNSCSLYFCNLWSLLIVLIIGLQSVHAYVVEGDECLFRVDVVVKFTTFDTTNYPLILGAPGQAINLSGTGPVYGENKGKVTFYVITPNGRLVDPIYTNDLQPTLGTVLLLRKLQGHSV